MILFRKYRIKRLMKRKEALDTLIRQYQALMIILPPFIQINHEGFNAVVAEREEVNEKLLCLGVAKDETKAVLNLIRAKESA